MSLWQQESRVCQVIAELDNGGSHELGYPSTTALVAEVARTASAAVRKLVARALAINPSRGIDGAEIPAAAPLTGEAAAEGAISPLHVDEIVSALQAIPDTVPVDEREKTEKTLVDLARNATTAEVAAAGQRLRDTLDPDGREPRETPEPARVFRYRQGKDGSIKFDGYLDPVSSAKTLALLEPLALPHKNGGTAAPPTSATSSSSADTTTAYSTTATGKSAWLTGCPSSPHRSSWIPGEDPEPTPSTPHNPAPPDRNPPPGGPSHHVHNGSRPAGIIQSAEIHADLRRPCDARARCPCTPAPGAPDPPATRRRSSSRWRSGGRPPGSPS
ncbi:hypothetical protein HUW46_01820 [Amycolatopsis sp. CA-230715]|nr:hypothetical protein HUW46_01820 [Amycolatopsis sp. CA-230715]